MFIDMFKKIFGSVNERYLKKLHPIVQQINNLEPEVAKLTDDELKARTDWLKQRFQNGESLDALLNDAFATVREVSKRVLEMRHFDEQLVGGIILHRGMIAEMKTGEGKTLVATLPVYLNALAGKGVHVVSVNDYLVKRDSEWMGKIYRFLGMSVGCITNELSDEQRKQAYNCDITYGTNNEYGFDYLRDNMKFDINDIVQREFNYAIVDEVDSILIDEARTPLIISGPAEDSSELYMKVDRIIPQLTKEDYDKDEKSKSITLTEQGTQKIEELLLSGGLLETGSLYDIHNVSLVHHVNQSLRAHHMFERDVDYIVKDNKVIIIDEFTGRMMDGRRYSEGLHQALEAKEKANIEVENQTLASITFQNYFRLYKKLAGMTGTAQTEAAEFADIYKLEVIEVPTHRPITRIDHEDEVYRTEREKIESIVKLISQCQEKEQPVLVGTVSIEKSEHLSAVLTKKKIPHKVLNARYHEMEAQIIAQAGAPGAVTIATNMAGRGTDIKLGGNWEMLLELELQGITDPNKMKKIEEQVRKSTSEAEQKAKDAGGLYVIATERHESRRIDNQLRGRSGRLGDPGASKFFLSLEDDLMRIFGSEKLDAVLQRLGLEEGESITHPWVTKALERAQQKVEARNYDIRKHLLKYDDVMNDQRKVIYNLRRDLLTSEDAKDIVFEMREDTIDMMVDRHIPIGTFAEQWEINSLYEDVKRICGLDLPIVEWCAEEGIAEEEIKSRIRAEVEKTVAEKEQKYGANLMRVAEKSLLLRILDSSWKDHLHSLDHLRQGINLRAYAQRDPLNEYKNEAFNMFKVMLDEIKESVTTVLLHLQIDMGETDQNSIRQDILKDSEQQKLNLIHPSKASDDVIPVGDDYLERESVKRNDPCPCGSGKRYKHCHGR